MENVVVLKNNHKNQNIPSLKPIFPHLQPLLQLINLLLILLQQILLILRLLFVFLLLQFHGFQSLTQQILFFLQVLAQTLNFHLQNNTKIALKNSFPHRTPLTINSIFFFTALSLSKL